MRLVTNRWLISLVLGLGAFGLANAEAKELRWEDLMPKDWAPELPGQPQSHDALALESSRSLQILAPVVESLNDQQIRIPGFVIPVEFAEDSVTEFLLVPYMGACIHVPPPPSNQMVYVKLAKPISTANLWDPVWVEGKMKTENFKTRYADTGYVMESAVTEVYRY